MKRYGLAESSDRKSLKASHTFRPYERIRCSADFQRVKTAGKRAKSFHFGLNYIPNGREYHRLGLVVQKRFWPAAVGRNRIKRVIREWFRLHKGEIPAPSKDIVVIARPGAEKLSPGDLHAEFSRILYTQGNSR